MSKTYYRLSDSLVIEVLAASPDPEKTAWLAMHQCYYENAVSRVTPVPPNYGEAVVKHLLKGNRGHYSPLEHNAITFAVQGFPHSVMQQYRTHRTGISFSVQSTRYTGMRVVEYIEGHRTFEDVFYLRKPGRKYMGRNGSYEITEDQYELMHNEVHRAAMLYHDLILSGHEPETARYVLPGYALRQNFVMTVNARSLMHLLDLRMKKDAEYESCILAELMLDALHDWMPNLAEWYRDSRAWTARLSP